MRTRPVVLAAVLALVAGTGVSVRQQAAKASCQPEGVWDRVSTTYQGKTEQVTTYQQRKVVTKGHFLWLQQDLKRDTLRLKTPLDSARVYSLSGGAGTWSVVGDRYTEKIEFFDDPQLIGKPLTARCRMEGDRWYHMFDIADVNPPGTPHDTLVEVWRRVE